MALPGHVVVPGENEVSRGGGGGKGKKGGGEDRGGEAGTPCGFPHPGAPQGHAHKHKF